MKENFSARDLFRRIINFENSPRTLKWEFGYWSETIFRWYKEGLPCKSNIIDRIDVNDTVNGPANPLHYNQSENPPIDTDIAEFFKFDKGQRCVPYHYFHYPVFEEKIVEEDDKYVIKYDQSGIKVKQLKDKSSMPFWLDFPVKNRFDWEKIKEERLRLDNFDARFIGNKAKFYEEAKNRDYVLGIFGGFGFFGSLRFLMGEERLFMTYYDDPGLIKDICGHLCNMWLSMAEELTPNIEFDLAFFWEDMSGKNGSLISPATFREFMMPYYQKITDFLKSKKIDKSIVDTDGNVEKLIPLFLEAGVNIMNPFERQADNDLIKYRKEFPDMVMMGGFDKNTLYKGKEAIDRELKITKWLISQGGYVPFCDHVVPPNSSWENFKYYRNRLNEIIGSS